MKRCFWIFAVILALGLAFGVDVIAQTQTPESGNSSTAGVEGMRLTEELYCKTKGVISGPVGMMAGLFMAVLGLWMLVQGVGVFPALVMLVSGSLITAVPGFIESTLSGLGGLLNEAGLTAGNAFAPPQSCSSTVTPDREQTPMDWDDECIPDSPIYNTPECEGEDGPDWQ